MSNKNPRNILYWIARIGIALQLASIAWLSVEVLRENIDLKEFGLMFLYFLVSVLIMIVLFSLTRMKYGVIIFIIFLAAVYYFFEFLPGVSTEKFEASNVLFLFLILPTIFWIGPFLSSKRVKRLYKSITERTAKNKSEKQK